MRHQSNFTTGRHLAAARTLAGLKQTELAALAGLHVNSLKRLEAMAAIQCKTSPHAVERINKALLAAGVIAEGSPMPLVRLFE